MIVELPERTLSFLRFAYNYADKTVIDGRKPSMIIAFSTDYIIAGFSYPPILHVSKWMHGVSLCMSEDLKDNVAKIVLDLNDKVEHDIAKRILSSGKLTIQSTGNREFTIESKTKGYIVPKNECILCSDTVEAVNWKTLLESSLSKETLDILRILEEELLYTVLDTTGDIISDKTLRIPPEISHLRVEVSRSSKAFLLPPVFSILYNASRKLDWGEKIKLRITRGAPYPLTRPLFFMFLNYRGDDDWSEYLAITDPPRPVDVSWMSKIWKPDYLRVKPERLLVETIKSALSIEAHRGRTILLTRNGSLVVAGVWQDIFGKMLLYTRPLQEGEKPVEEPVAVFTPNVTTRNAIIRLIEKGIIPVTMPVDEALVVLVNNILDRLDNGETTPVFTSKVSSPEDLYSININLEKYGFGWLAEWLHTTLPRLEAPKSLLLTILHDNEKSWYIASVDVGGGRRIIGFLLPFNRLIETFREV